MPKAKPAVRVKGVLYARVSSKEQEQEGFSVDAQLRLLKAYAAEKGVEVARVFTEAETAKASGRTAFGEMLRFLSSHPGHVVLVEKVDRLYRNFADYVKVDDLKVEVHFVKDGMVVGESSRSQDKFMHGIRVLMAKNYVDNLSEEIRKGLNEKAAQGIYPTHAPLGYLNVQEAGTKRKTIVPDPARAHLVKEMFELYASGLYSMEQLTKLLRKKGLRSKKGRPLPKSAVAQMLEHPAYYGVVKWNGVESPGVHEPLVTREVWQRVQDVRTGRGSSNKGYGSKEFTYRGLVRCACGESMTAEVKKGRYTYYHCTGRKREICGRPFVSEEAITDAFSKLLERVTVPEEFLPWIREGLREADRDRRNTRKERERDIERNLSAVKRRLEKLYLDKCEGQVSPEFYTETRAKWESEATDLKLELAAMERAEPVAVDSAMRMFELASTAALRYKMAPSEVKREILATVCSNCVWRDGKLEVQLNEFFDLMLNLVISSKPQEPGNQENPLVGVTSDDWWR